MEGRGKGGRGAGWAIGKGRRGGPAAGDQPGGDALGLQQWLVVGAFYSLYRDSRWGVESKMDAAGEGLGVRDHGGSIPRPEEDGGAGSRRSGNGGGVQGRRLAAAREKGDR